MGGRSKRRYRLRRSSHGLRHRDSGRTPRLPRRTFESKRERRGVREGEDVREILRLQSTHSDPRETGYTSARRSDVPGLLAISSSGVLGGGCRFDLRRDSAGLERARSFHIEQEAEAEEPRRLRSGRRSFDLSDFRAVGFGRGRHDSVDCDTILSPNVRRSPRARDRFVFLENGGSRSIDPRLIPPRSGDRSCPTLGADSPAENGHHPCMRPATPRDALRCLLVTTVRTSQRERVWDSNARMYQPFRPSMPHGPVAFFIRRTTEGKQSVRSAIYRTSAFWPRSPYAAFQERPASPLSCATTTMLLEHAEPQA